MKMIIVLALAAAVACEPEADPALLYTAAGYPYSAYSSVQPLAAPLSYSALPITSYTAAPLSPYAVATPAAPIQTYSAYKTIAAPAVYSAVNPVSAYAGFPVAPATHTLTSYSNPNQYTAVSNGAVGPKYIAKNFGVEHIVKREAEAEADPALVYSALPAAYSALPTTYSAAVPATYSVLPATYSAAVPATYSALPAAYSALPATYSALPATYSALPAAYSALPATTYSTLPATYSALPATTYSTLPATYSALPATYSALPTTYAAPTVVKSMYAPHAIAATPFGYTHSSNVGICTNNNGEQVAC